MASKKSQTNFAQMNYRSYAIPKLIKPVRNALYPLKKNKANFLIHLWRPTTQRSSSMWIAEERLERTRLDVANRRNI